MASQKQQRGKKKLETEHIIPEDLTVEREDFNRNLRKLIQAPPLRKDQIRPEKRKPAKIIQPKF